MSAEAACLLLKMSEPGPLTTEEALLNTLSRLNLEFPGIWDNDAVSTNKRLQIPAHPHVTMSVRVVSENESSWDGRHAVYAEIRNLNVGGTCNINLDLGLDMPESRGLSIRSSGNSATLFLAGQMLVWGFWRQEWNIFRFQCTLESFEKIVHSVANAPTERELRVE